MFCGLQKNITYKDFKFQSGISASVSHSTMSDIIIILRKSLLLLISVSVLSVTLYAHQWYNVSVI